MDTETIIYENNYNDTYNNLRNRSILSGFSINDIKRELESLYRYEDLDWTGRGEYKNSEIQGAVTAYQVFLHEWNKEKKSNI
ncbi:MAG: hypothetical protein JXR86_21235 [Spirochaetales bacterium]|nr:hypothetical protein [Spirochaetales bacterium]